MGTNLELVAIIRKLEEALGVKVSSLDVIRDEDGNIVKIELIDYDYLFGGF